ncbi:uncharacterized protein LOC131660936 [Vicia villosa]|uniref:uncharacterized protein LOC131660936 n=1 Tax=Vicia villosa TaxID=3911 RepID=UPI00273CECFA|nr:uncharacterized protein LOC131660936 [Vicia villosa]
MLQSGKVDVCFLQETKLSSFNLKLAEELWGAKDVDWTHLDSTGASGGSAILWRKDSLELHSSYRDFGYVGMKADINGMLVNFINVYAPCNYITRTRVWRSIIRRKLASSGEEWCVGGDFNTVMYKEERIGIGTGSFSRDSNDFCNFVETMELIDLLSVEGRFTWFSGNGRSMSGISDWGPKPFRFNNSWYLNENFKSYVTEEWRKLNYRGRGDYCVYEKLKSIKSKLKDWNRDVFGWIDLKISNNIDDQARLDQLLVDNIGMDATETVEQRRKTIENLWKNLEIKENMLRIKSGQRWRNSLTSVKTSTGTVEGVSQVKHHVWEHFANFFKESYDHRSILEGISFNRLEEVTAASLEAPFNELEIKQAVWDCEGSKTPGPDGFTMEFFKNHWDILKEDLMKFVSDFHAKETLIKACTSSFITLIPKTPNPQNLSEYRPICLVGSLLKILSKLLAARLKLAIDRLISIKQSAFIKKRNIMDGVVVVNELMDLAKRDRRSCLIMKVDYEKAYDSVSWNYLRFMMKSMGFGCKWQKWMEACVFVSSMAVIVNGSSTNDFKVERGLRQGDPLSPLLFVIAMEGLTRLMEKAVETGDFKGFQYGDNNFVDILQFADDTIIFGESDHHNLWSWKTILRGFELMSGLRINFRKSNIYGINLPVATMQQISTFMSCGMGSTPFNFLGVMFYRAPKKVIKEIISIQRNFLWKGVEGERGINWVKWKDVCKAKEEGGLGIRDIETMNISLLMKWKWRILTEENTVWKDILKYRYHTPEVKMFVNDDNVMNKKDSLWWRDLQLINDCASSKGEILPIKTSTKGISASDLFSCRVKNGSKTSFWFSKWIENQSLSESFPELYAKAVNPFMTVAEAGHWEEALWCWDVDHWLTEYDEDDEFLIQIMVDMLHQFQPEQQTEDEFKWAGDAEEEFTVKLCAHTIKKRDTENMVGIPVRKTLLAMWDIKAPSKVKIFAWRLILDRLPTKDQLKKRGILDTDRDCCCVFCSQEEESSKHLFDSCPITRNIWSRVGGWLGNSCNLSIEELPSFFTVSEKIKGVEERLTLGVIWLAVVWNIWKMRNAIIFNGCSFNFDDCYSAIVLASWKWFRLVNSSSTSCNFHFWNILPLSCIKR